MGKNPQLAPNFKWPAEIIDINDTNTKLKIGNKINVLKAEKLKLFPEYSKSETDTDFQELNFKDTQFNSPITRMHAKLIQYKDAAPLVLFLLDKADAKINAMCDIPFDQCPICDPEENYIKDKQKIN